MGWIGLGWDGLDLCVGLLYEHRFAMLIKANRSDFEGSTEGQYVVLN